jgi:hypothetical protein
MPVVDFDLATAGGYVRSFSSLHSALASRVPGRVVELNVALPGGSLNLFLEASSLYLVAIRALNKDILVLHGGREQSYLPYFPAKEFGKTVDTGIPARYDGSTWRLTFTAGDLALCANLPALIAARNVDAAKAAIDRLAFAISEAARFLPVRCAVACELSDDLVFKEIVARLATWAGTFVTSERNIGGGAKIEDLPREDARLRLRLGDENMKVFRVKENAFLNLVGAAKWLAILSSSESERTELDRQRLSGVRQSMRVHAMRLGDFRALIANWEKFSAIARRDPNFAGLVDAFHTRYAVGAAPAEGSLTLAEWT